MMTIILFKNFKQTVCFMHQQPDLDLKACAPRGPSLAYGQIPHTVACPACHSAVLRKPRYTDLVNVCLSGKNQKVMLLVNVGDDTEPTL